MWHERGLCLCVCRCVTIVCVCTEQREAHPLLDFVRVMWHEPNRKVKRVKLYFIHPDPDCACSLQYICFKCTFIWTRSEREWRVPDWVIWSLYHLGEHEPSAWHSNWISVAYCTYIGYRLTFFARNLCISLKSSIFVLSIVCPSATRVPGMPEALRNLRTTSFLAFSWSFCWRTNCCRPKLDIAAWNTVLWENLALSRMRVILKASIWKIASLLVYHPQFHTPISDTFMWKLLMC